MFRLDAPYFCPDDTGAFSRNVSKLFSEFSELKLVTDDLPLMQKPTENPLKVQPRPHTPFQYCILIGRVIEFQTDLLKVIRPSMPRWGLLRASQASLLVVYSVRDGRLGRR